MAGKWDPIGRQAAKALGYVFGLALLALAWRWGALVFGNPDPSIWQIGGLVAVLLLAGAALLPGTVVPIIYKVIEKVGKDSPPE